MHATRSSHRKARLPWNLSHGNGNAFRVHKKNPTDSCKRLITTDYNHTFTEWSNYRIFGLFWDNWSYIVHRAKLSYKYDNYRTPGNTVCRLREGLWTCHSWYPVGGALGAQGPYYGPFGKCTTEGRACFTFLAVSQIWFRCVIDSARAALCQRFCL